MLRVFWLIVSSTTFFFALSTARTPCTVLSSSYFKWLDDDGYLVLNSIPGGADIATYQYEVNDTCCGAMCEEEWTPLNGSSNCQFCSSINALVCHGSNVYSLPNPSTLPSKQLSLFKMSGVGLIALPPNSFTGLTIARLVIQDSNLTYIASETFAGVKSVTSLYLTNNTLDYIYQAGHVFNHLPNLRILNLENNGLRILSSLHPANLRKLEYLSLAGNPIYSLDVDFLQNSAIRFLNLRNVTFKVKPSDMQASGFSLLPASMRTIDLSGADISVKAIETMLSFFRDKNITMLNLGYLKQSAGVMAALLPVRDTLIFLSFQGTDMQDFFQGGPKEREIFIDKPFVRLKELNLKGCKISNLGDGKVFMIFPSLKSLSLSENDFNTLDLELFVNLPPLNYLDLSENSFKDIGVTIFNSNSTIKGIQALDLSLTQFDLEDKSYAFFSTLQNVTKLSLCGADIGDKVIRSMLNMKMKFLDLSNTLSKAELISAFSALFETQNSSLIELRFARNNFDMTGYPLYFNSLRSLEVLDLSNNMIRNIYKDMFGQNLTLMFLSQNLITTWYFPMLSSGSKLKYLDLANNQISFISDAMLEDFYKLEFLDLDSNPLICHKKVVAMVCADVMNKTHNLTILGWQQYNCYDIISKSFRLFAQPKDCNEYYEEVSTTYDHGGGGGDNPTTYAPDSGRSDDDLFSRSNKIWVYLMIGMVVLTSAVGSIVYAKWWNIRCYIHRYFSLKKARLLRKEGDPLTRPDIHYDVFVSYSDVDRSWILDQLIPNIEGDGDISLCFHERDFKVGLGILENIIECMDRSRALLLIVSSAFVRSKWCQFEMHLAQYRLIETLRDQLVLVLLEDIPRKSRPQTLHHLMMTKTYLIWPRHPNKEEATELFWKRLKRALRPNYNYMFSA
ncbi:toll-like receptor 2 type-2 [Homalodisca vitripennis]|uniref:toll-like receptor 2 type-2 n=1 Tax=Homalodisca vitripennis TaxID=197043 RepID=UPI001EE9EF3E|nr:toll-like receptor 2 type-2 [Homalodisca vitripennis]XP_046658786.1 toll-like receptor 2 type-2 [Homalodisca vitripennis]